MRQHAWLDYAYGVWHLVTERENDPVRFWWDLETALIELAEEGWALVGPFPRRYGKLWRLDRAYRLARSIQ
jgi:hypothetical protein